MANKVCNLNHVTDKLNESVCGAKEITIKMLAIRPADRPTAESLYNQPWISYNDYSLMSVDEHLDNPLQPPALLMWNVDDKDAMASVMLGNMNYHDPRSISSMHSYLLSHKS
jgi:hypothetical protein